MTPFQRILSNARRLAARTGIESGVYLAAWCDALARGVSTGFLRTGRDKPPAKAKREAHPETLVEGEG